MKLRIERIEDRGVPNQERLFLTVVEPTNLGSHLVVSSAYLSPQTVANGGRDCFWFPPQDVKAFDQVVLYTRAGNYSPPQLGLISNTYFYYWGRPGTIWNNLDTCALLFDVASWTASNNDAIANYMAQLAQRTQPSRNSLSEMGEALRLAGSQPPQGNALLQGLRRANKPINPLLPDDDDSNPFGNY